MSHEMGNTNPLLNKIHVELNPERINAHRNIESFYKFYQTRQKNRAVLEIERILYCVHQGQNFEGVSNFMIQKYKEFLKCDNDMIYSFFNELNSLNI